MAMNKKYFKTILFVLAAFSLVACSKQLILKETKITQQSISEKLIADTAIISFYAPYKKSLDSQMNVVVGSSAIALSKNSPDNNLSIFFADAVAAACKNKNAIFDFAFPTTNGGIRNSMPQGDWTLRNMYELMPFENECVLLTISGKKINELVRFVLSKGGQPLAGITIQSKPSTETLVKIAGLPVDTNRNYVVLTSDYLANGGDGITAFANPINKSNLNYKIRDALIDYVLSQKAIGKTIKPTIDGRIRIDQ